MNTLTVMFNVSFGKGSLLFAKNYGNVGVGPLVGDFIYHLDSLENMIQSAVAGYIQVNLKGDVNQIEIKQLGLIMVLVLHLAQYFDALRWSNP